MRALRVLALVCLAGCASAGSGDPWLEQALGGTAAIDRTVYPDLDEFWVDLSAAYADEVRALGDLGCRYLQLDDTSLAYLNDPSQRAELAARYRGNEIAVVLPGSSVAEAFERAERLRVAVAALDLSPLTNGAPLPITASLGIATYPRGAADAKELIERAFAAMWRARAGGTGRG